MYKPYRKYKPCTIYDTDKIDIQAQYFMLHGITAGRLLLLVPHDFVNDINQATNVEVFRLKSGEQIKMRRSIIVKEPIVVDLINEIHVEPDKPLLFGSCFVGRRDYIVKQDKEMGERNVQ